MSTWNVELRKRKEVIEVKQILQEWPEYVADFPGMEILDQEGRKHTLAALDFLSHEWDQIQAGSRIEITFRESIVNSMVLPTESLEMPEAGRRKRDRSLS